MNGQSSKPVPEDHPLMIAWRAYQGTDDFINTRQWADHKEHVDGSLWAVFVAGYAAAGGDVTVK